MTNIFVFSNTGIPFQMFQEESVQASVGTNNPHVEKIMKVNVPALCSFWVFTLAFAHDASDVKASPCELKIDKWLSKMKRLPFSEICEKWRKNEDMDANVVACKPLFQLDILITLCNALPPQLPNSSVIFLLTVASNLLTRLLS